MQSASHLEGQTLKGCYLIEKRIAKGGMAWVYLARHTGLHANVAIKFLFPSLVEEEHIRLRFLAEARILYRLKHPHIVQVTDLIVEGSLIGMVMEWVEGEDLKAWHKQHAGPVSFEAIQAFLTPILEALQYIHDQHFVHRDLKPANILLAVHEGILIPKISDFGIAKLIAGDSATATGSQMGTIAYMPPEQIQDAKHVDHRADIYSLGIMLFELLTGHTPFIGEVHQVMLKQLSEIPPSLRTLREDIPPALDEIVLRCLAKDPGARFQSCEELQYALREVWEALGLPDGHAVSASKQAPGTVPLPDGSLLRHASAPVRESSPNAIDAYAETALASQLSPPQAPHTQATALQQQDQPRRTPWLFLSLILVALVILGGFFFGVWRSLLAPPLSQDPGALETDPPNSRKLASITPKPRNTTSDPSTQPPVVPTARPPVVPSARPPTGPPARTPVIPTLRPQDRPSVKKTRVSLLVTARPEGAEVWIGKKRKGSTPYRLRGTPGTPYIFTLKHPDFLSRTFRGTFGKNDATKRFQLREPSLDQQIALRFRRLRRSTDYKRKKRSRRPRVRRVRANPQPRVRTRPFVFQVYSLLTLRSEPPGAQVWFEGKRIGKTPHRFKRPLGSAVTLILKKKCYKPLSKTFKMAKKQMRFTWKLTLVHKDRPCELPQDPFK